MSPEQIHKLESGVAEIRRGSNRHDAVAILGTPSRQELTSHQEKPNEVMGRLYYYDVRIVDPGIANVFDQQIVLVFDYKSDQLRQIMSSVPEIR